MAVTNQKAAKMLISFLDTSVVYKYILDRSNRLS